jgi:tRNA-dihydrouridine synthase 4
MGAALIHKRELVAEMIKEAKATLEREGWGESRTVSVKIRIHKDLRFVTSTHIERIEIDN